MTTSKPEVVAYQGLDGHLVNSTTHPEYYNALVLLSDYESLQAECDTLVAALVEALEGIMRVEARDRVMPVGAEWDAARAALAAHRKQGGDV